MWYVVDREVNKHPHNTLASFNSKISDVMTNIGREIVIPNLRPEVPVSD
jgi:hypothetical protein